MWDIPGCTFLFGDENAAKQDVDKYGFFKVKDEDKEV